MPFISDIFSKLTGNAHASADACRVSLGETSVESYNCSKKPDAQPQNGLTKLSRFGELYPKLKSETDAPTPELREALLHVQVLKHVILGQAKDHLGSDAASPETTRQARQLVDNPKLAELYAVDHYVNNRVKYKEDKDNYGQADYWASPAETLKNGNGDCEDYASTKWAILRMMGWSSEQMWWVYSRAHEKNGIITHMTLAVKSGEEVFNLNNLTESREKLLPTLDLESQTNGDFSGSRLDPVFMFNSHDLLGDFRPSAPNEPMSAAASTNSKPNKKDHGSLRLDFISKLPTF